MQYQGSSAVEFKFKFSQARERPGLPSVSAAVSVSAGPSESVPEQVHCAPTKKGLFRKVIGEHFGPFESIKKKPEIAPGKVRKAGVQSHPGSSRVPNEFPLVIIGVGQANASFSNSTASGECGSELRNIGIARVGLKSRRNDDSKRHRQLSQRGE